MIPEQEARLLAAIETIARDHDRSMRADDVVKITAAGTLDDLEFETVKAGRELVITHLGGYDENNATTTTRVGYKAGGAYYWWKTAAAPAAAVTTEITGEFRLREGQMPVVRFVGATAADDLTAILNGYWIPVPGR